MLLAIWFYQILKTNLFFQELFLQNLLIFIALFFFFFGVCLIYRLFISFFIFPIGEILPHSKSEFYWMIYTLFWLFFFNPLMNSRILPIPLTRPFYRLLGCRVGEGTYFAGLVLDAHFVSFGQKVIVGMDSKFVPHVFEGPRLAHYPIKIEDGVTIGAGSIILAGSQIGKNSIIGAISLVPKNSKIGENEVWAGIPARFIKKIQI
jgi:hypothetical protein